tara:strand:- start:12 stop:269 length:258 start_codon:yes stop_codon:yes gene_type:complete
MIDLLQLFTIPSDDNFLVVLAAFFSVSLFYTWKLARMEGFYIGLGHGLDAVEEALELDQQAQDDLYEKMSKNLVTRLEIISDDEN